MTKHEAVKKLTRWLDAPGLSAEAIIDFMTDASQDEDGEQNGLGMLPPMTKKGHCEWEAESNTSNS